MTEAGPKILGLVEFRERRNRGFVRDLAVDVEFRERTEDRRFRFVITFRHSVCSLIVLARSWSMRDKLTGHSSPEQGAQTKSAVSFLVFAMLCLWHFPKVKLAHFEHVRHDDD